MVNAIKTRVLKLKKRQSKMILPSEVRDQVDSEGNRPSSAHNYANDLGVKS